MAFERVKLAVGEEKTVTFELTGEDLQLVDATGAYVLIHGEWTVFCGEASASFAILGVCWSCVLLLVWLHHTQISIIITFTSIPSRQNTSLLSHHNKATHFKALTKHSCHFVTH